MPIILKSAPSENNVLTFAAVNADSCLYAHPSKGSEIAFWGYRQSYIYKNVKLPKSTLQSHFIRNLHMTDSMPHNKSIMFRMRLAHLRKHTSTTMHLCCFFLELYLCKEINVYVCVKLFNVICNYSWRN